MFLSFSCDDDGPFKEYLVARPVLMDAVAFIAEAIDILELTPVLCSGKI